MYNECEWFNSACTCSMCDAYRTRLVRLPIEEQEADYSWDDTWEFITRL